MIPEIGGKELSRMALTVKTEEEAMKRMVEKGIDTVVIISPHNLCFYDGPALFLAPSISGNLSAFGRPDVSMTLSIDPMLSEAILKEAEPLIPLHRVDKAEAARYGKALTVDWGTFVPMYYLLKAGFQGQAVMLSPAFPIMKSMKSWELLWNGQLPNWGGKSASSPPVIYPTS